MPPKPNRSPVLGYNHNLKYRGRIFHIQSEDSGPQNPRLFTHLYFGGTILASKKHEYDPAAPEDVVRALMQSQHKSILKELKAGKHDDRIIRFFSARGETLEASVTESVGADAQTLDLDAAPEPGQRSAISSVEMPALSTHQAPRPTAFADTFEDEPTTPDEARAAATASAAAAVAASATAASGMAAPTVEKTIEMDMRAVMAGAQETGAPAGSDEPANNGPSRFFPMAGRRRITRSTPALGAPVVVERTMGVGTQSPTGARPLMRGRKPAPSIPYVVKEGSHPLADETPAPSMLPPAVAMSPPPTTAANAPLTSGTQGRFPAPPPPPPAEKSLDEVILAYLAQGGDER